MDLIYDLQRLTRELDISIKSLRKTGQDYAKAYTDYRIALSKELLKLRDEGMPVTIAYDVARGKSDIAKLKFEEICKQSIFQANQEAISAIKLQIRIIESQISREYSNAGGV